MYSNTIHVSRELGYNFGNCSGQIRSLIGAKYRNAFRYNLISCNFVIVTDGYVSKLAQIVAAKTAGGRENNADL